VLYATLNDPPLNLIGPELVRDLVTLILHLESHTDISVVVFDSANPEFFSAHVDMHRAAELGPEIARLEPGAPLGALYRRISTLDQVSIAVITGRVRGAGSEFTLACDMRFAIDSAVFGQPEVGIGAIPGAGAVQHLARLMGRGRALEALIGADDFCAELAERYGWINRALPADELPVFISTLASRIARFPFAGRVRWRKHLFIATSYIIADAPNYLGLLPSARWSWVHELKYDACCLASGDTMLA
jgi:enoyl-CoA hydratase/carnithine racemase